MNRRISLSKNNIIRLSIGLIYLFFGFLKFFPDISPAEELVTKTINILTFDLIPNITSIKILATWETSIGLLLISNYQIRIVIITALIHMLSTFTPLILLPESSFNGAYYLPSLQGQYILKNIVLVCALISIYPTKSGIKQPFKKTKKQIE